MTILARVGLITACAALASAAHLTANWNDGKQGFEVGSLIETDPAVVMAEATSELRTKQGVASPELAARVELAGRTAPLASEPFLLAALTMPSERAANARRELLEAARRRDPRNIEARMFLLDEYLRAGDVEAAVDEIAVLMRLISIGREKLQATLTWLVANPETRSRTIARVMSSPLRPQLLSDLARLNVSPFLIEDLAPDLAGAAKQVKQQKWLRTVIDPYVNRRAINDAWQLWAFFSDVDPRQISLLRDPSFTLQSSPPFGWNIATEDGGVVERRGNRLHVIDYGRATWTPASQLLRLGPGQYRLKFETRAASGEAPALTWQVDCLGTAGRVLELPIGYTGAFADTVSDQFIVPAEGCPAQWLKLVVQAAEFRRTRSGSVGGISLMKVNAQ